MNSTHILITGCKDHLMWYSRLVGCMYDLVRDLPEERCYLSREPAGYTNIVRHADAVLVPFGHFPAERGTLIQQHDLVLVRRRWSLPALDELGTPVEGHIVIRRSTP